MALIQAKSLFHSFGVAPLLDHVDVTIESKSRVALIGRNGAGKSTLMRMLAGHITPDEGEIIYQSGLTIGYFEQEVPSGISGSVFDVVAESLAAVREAVSEYEALTMHMVEASADEQDVIADKLSALQHYIEQYNGWDTDYQIEQAITQLSLDKNADFQALSGGKKRRVMLAKSLVRKPDVLFLDEPTNHLDVESIEYLETWFQGFAGTIIFISHDRSFIDALATEIIEIDRGRLQRFEGNYQSYLRRKEEMLAIEEEANAQFDKRLAAEEAWVRQGIKARRTRNEGRVRALKAMRAQRAERRVQEKSANFSISEGERSGRIIAKTHEVGLCYGEQQLFSGLTTTIVRGDKIGIIGPNGVGKSSLIKLLLGQIEPTEGTIKLGMNLQIGYLDQLRDTLQENLSIIDNIREGSDFVTVNGKEVHIMSYMQQFLFTPERIRTPVRALSGGERNRVLLAKLFTQPINVLVLDEPTNDLDIDTLEVLEGILSDFKGTLLLISHDRAFLDNIVTQTLVFEHGNVQEYVGGYEDWLRQRPSIAKPATKSTTLSAEANSIQSPQSEPQQRATQAAKPQKALSYQEKKELNNLPKQIEKLEARVATLTEQLQDPALYEQADKLHNITEELERAQADLDQKMDRWMELEG